MDWICLILFSSSCTELCDCVWDDSFTDSFYLLSNIVIFALGQTSLCVMDEIKHGGGLQSNLSKGKTIT